MPVPCRHASRTSECRVALCPRGGCGYEDPAVGVADGLLTEMRDAQMVGDGGRSMEQLVLARAGLANGGKALGIADAGGDALDDDGLLTVTSAGEYACVRLPNYLREGAVVGGACW